MISTFFKLFVRFFSSLKLTVFSLFAWIIVIFLGTIVQKDLGVYYAKKQYFDSWFLFFETSTNWRIPYFPGGALIGSILILNLIFAHFTRFKWTLKKSGIWLIHIGLMVLLIGSGIGLVISKESQLPLQIGETKSYVQRYHALELAFEKSLLTGLKDVVSIPTSLLAAGGMVNASALSVDIVVHNFWHNSRLSKVEKGIASQGIGRHAMVNRLKLDMREFSNNGVSALIELVDKKTQKSLGTWLVSSALGQAQKVRVGDDFYEIALRPMREYLPYQVTLLDFRHDKYLGSGIPKNFSSKVEIQTLNGDKSVHEIYMNHPLRYKGKTFYQASFGNNNQLSVLQVVENGVWWWPYLGSLLISLGLILHFIIVMKQRLLKGK